MSDGRYLVTRCIPQMTEALEPYRSHIVIHPAGQLATLHHGEGAIYNYLGSPLSDTKAAFLVGRKPDVHPEKHA